MLLRNAVGQIMRLRNCETVGRANGIRLDAKIGLGGDKKEDKRDGGHFTSNRCTSTSLKFKEIVPMELLNVDSSFIII